MITLKQKRLKKIRAAERFMFMLYELSVIDFVAHARSLAYFEHKVYEPKTKV